MAQDMFSKWDKAIDTEGLAKDVAEAAANGGQGNYKEVPHGEYEVAVQQMELKASKKGDPMVSIWFKIVSDGDFKGSLIFYNQVITQGFQIHNCNEMLRMMVSEMGADAPVVEFKSYSQYAELLMDVHEAVADNFEYALKYTANKKNKEFSDFEITEVFVLE
ncbi:MAG: DUF669 domain-containing protein [Methanocorpusculum sp.]|nr:DUF669 domain-containing protein [Methanocorpusculum sp.]